MPRTLFKQTLKSSPGIQYDVAPDGKRFLLNIPVDESVEPISLVQNWTRMLDRK